MKEWLKNGGPQHAAILAMRAGTPALLGFLLAQIMLLNDKMDTIISLLVRR